MTITIKDVAKMAGVSISTVSRVINNSKPVSDDIREKVTQVIKETNYKPNPLARNLVLRKNNFIGVIIPDVSDYKMGELLSGIEEVGKIYEFDILLCNSYGDFEEEKRYLELLANKQVAGIVFASKNITQEHLNMIEVTNIPVIYISKNAKDFNIPSVGVNHAKAGADVARYIIEKGFHSVCLAESLYESMPKDSEIAEGFEEVIAGTKISYEKCDIPKKGDKYQDSYDFVCGWIESKKQLPEIFFATGDDLAAGIINALTDNGVRVPQDVSVIGYDNSKISTVVRPALTTLHQPLYDIGALAIGVLIKRIVNEDNTVEAKELQHQIMERDSVR